MDGKSTCAVAVFNQLLYSSMISRGNNRPHTLTGYCIPPLTTVANAYNRVEELTDDIPLLCTQLRVCQQCGYALSSENNIENGKLGIIEIFQVILRIRPTIDCFGFCEY